MKEFSRICPKCSKIVYHKTKNSCNLCKDRPCRSCSASEINKRPGMRDYFIERWASSKNTGKNNPFYGKKHTKESKQKMHKDRDYSVYRTDEFKKKISDLSKGDKNGMFGKSFYDVWVEKFGVEVADLKLKDLKIKQSINMSGSNNHMYGKPSPQGSGNGWSGWYKGWFFRSLRELSYVINFIEPNNKKWISGEAAKIRIPYVDWKGFQRNYTPDFLIDDYLIIEIKPQKLQKTPQVRLKELAAIEYCKNNNMKYEMKDPTPLDDDIIKKLYHEGTIKFTKRYESLFLEKFK